MRASLGFLVVIPVSARMHDLCRESRVQRRDAAEV